MDTPRRRSRRLEGLRPEPPENSASVLRVKRALVEIESGDPEVTREPGSPRSLRQPDPGSPGHQPETSPGSPLLQHCASRKPPQRLPEPCSRPPQLQQEPSLESPRKPPESSPDPPRREPEPKKEPPARCEVREDPGTEPGPGSPRHEAQLGSESLEPCPGQAAPGPEPSGPLQELTRQSPGTPRALPEPRKPPPARDVATDDIGAKKRKGSAAPAPAEKKSKKEEMPVIPKGKPKSGRVWKDRSKKRFSHMVQDKPLRTSWQRKMKERQERKLVKDFARHLEEEKARLREEKKQRRAENLKRRLENERRAEVVQVIRNPAKLKRAKKRQLRSVQKRDTLFALQKTPPRQLPAELGSQRVGGAGEQGPP
ncbi:coiled-coil domain-containing protein 86 [Sorex fumeus]|uniref:coiled-coil domain-containing protein 86 n=1 Tax=Sorex fumeus TaxID=62283 RepID=UPI0024AE2040|nr:coiled-coil domain-containing protein 86 [Sorex fumeus]